MHQLHKSTRYIRQVEEVAAIGSYREQDRKLASELHAPEQPAAPEPEWMHAACALAVACEHAEQLEAPELERVHTACLHVARCDQTEQPRAAGHERLQKPFATFTRV